VAPQPARAKCGVFERSMSSGLDRLASGKRVKTTI